VRQLRYVILRWVGILLGAAFWAATGLAASHPVTPPDPQLEAELRIKLAKSVVGRDGFTLRVKDGVVYWEGATGVAQHKGAATRMAKAAGARRVVNNIRVRKGALPLTASPNKTLTTEPAKPSAPKPTAKEMPPASADPPASPPAKPHASVQWTPARP
jgi:hypothetical protein